MNNIDLRLEINKLNKIVLNQTDLVMREQGTHENTQKKLGAINQTVRSLKIEDDAEREKVEMVGKILTELLSR